MHSVHSFRPTKNSATFLGCQLDFLRFSNLLRTLLNSYVVILAINAAEMQAKATQL